MRDLAPAAALGALDAAEALAFEAHVAGGCERCAREVEAFTELAGLLAHQVPQRSPRASVRERLLAQLASAAGALPRPVDRPAAPPAPGFTVIRSADRVWEPVPGMAATLARFLDDPSSPARTFLVRLEPGARGEWSGGIAEVFVIEGDVAVMGQKLGAGDYAAAPAGASPTRLESRAGCTLLLLDVREPGDPGSAELAGRPGEAHVARGGDGSWRPGAVSGVETRRLSPRGRPPHTSVVRMQAGVRLPRHRHLTVEQFYLLEGDADVTGQRLGRGDYYRAPAGTVHEVTSTESGCSFVLMSSAIELLA
jgi:anti-sigma factor ChrR (cupin superfamily)